MTLADIVLFGGTTEGRVLARFLREQGRSALVCVATDYGASLLSDIGPVTTRVGRLDAKEMEALLQGQRPRLVIDATHPYANEVSRNIQTACAAAGVPCWRVRREEKTTPQEEDGSLTFPTMAALVSWLNETPGVIFSTLGAQEALALAAVRGGAERLWLRILPLEESLRLTRQAGVPAKHIIAMQGPFSQALNEALFRETGADILLTKDSGRAGGFAEKWNAARACGMRVAVLARPREEGLSLEEIKRRMQEGAI